ncbi:MAG: polysaccharide deacetylase family protein [Candidatus Nanopelagicales bacterium]
MRRWIPVLLAVCALGASGCAAQKAESAEPTAAPVAAAEPRPTAAVDLESRGPAQVVHSVDTKDKVVFLTIDDGLDAEPATMRYLSENKVPVTVFLTTGTVTDWQYWKDMGPTGSIQNHTVVHPTLTQLGEAGQEAEICAANEAIVGELGQAPWMVRPPYGAYDSTTLAAAGRCGLDWVVHWTVTAPGDDLLYQQVDGSLKPGDIVLTHFRKGLAKSLPKIVEAIHAQGFEIARLEDYLTPRGGPKPAGADVMPADAQMDTDTESKAYLVAD